MKINNYWRLKAFFLQLTMNFGGTLRLNKFACFTLIFVLFLIVYWRSGGSGYPTEKSDLINLKTLLKASIQAAERGGKKVIEGKDHKLNIQSKGKTLEGANDPVTDVDYASHCSMYYGFKNTFSKVHVVSEEHNKEDSSCTDQPPFDIEAVISDHRTIDLMLDELVLVRDVTVWIDPLDATQEYTGLYYNFNLITIVNIVICILISYISYIYFLLCVISAIGISSMSRSMVRSRCPAERDIH